jgi:hypothetical protein
MSYQLIGGECYIHGIADGEAMKIAKKGFKRRRYAYYDQLDKPLPMRLSSGGINRLQYPM